MAKAAGRSPSPSLDRAEADDDCSSNDEDSRGSASAALEGTVRMKLRSGIYVGSAAAAAPHSPCTAASLVTASALSETRPSARQQPTGSLADAVARRRGRLPTHREEAEASGDDAAPADPAAAGTTGANLLAESSLGKRDATSACGFSCAQSRSVRREVNAVHPSLVMASRGVGFAMDKLESLPLRRSGVSNLTEWMTLN